jgi:hypothetical protein
MTTKLHNSSFPKLPLLEDIHATFFSQQQPLRNTVLVCVQHLLETTGSLFEKLIELGLEPKNTFILGKIYSTNDSVVCRLRKIGFTVMAPTRPALLGDCESYLTQDCHQLWQTAAKSLLKSRPEQVIVLDDGGHLLACTPLSVSRQFPVRGVEQTMGGLVMQEAGRIQMPVVQVATSDAKKLIEPRMIQEAIFRRIKDLDWGVFGRVPGVVGVGSIGTAVLKGLLNRHPRICVFDKQEKPTANSPTVTVCSSIKDLFEQSSVIFGCTGRDILAHEKWWTDLRGHRELVSCSSHDVEFRTILRSVPTAPARNSGIFGDVEIFTKAGQVRIKHGGFPINFDGSPESVPPDDIQLTRGLLLGGIVQAAMLEPTLAAGYAPLILAPPFQSYLVHRWFQLERRRLKDYPKSTLDSFVPYTTSLRSSGMGLGILTNQ